MELTLTRLTGGRIQVDLRDADLLKERVTSTFRKPSQFEDVAATMALPKPTITAAVDDFEKRDVPRHVYDLASFVTDAPKFSIYARHITSAATTARTYSGDDVLQVFADAVAARDFGVDAEPLLYWSELDALAAIDIDVRPGEEYTPGAISSLLNRLKPTPFASWITHSGGVRLLYHAQDDFTAEEIAAVAYLNLSTTISYRGLEIKSDTRHPYYKRGDRICREFRQQVQAFDKSTLSRFLKQYRLTDDDVQQWLSAKGMTKSQRLPHDFCPVSPEKASHGDPVIVGDAGIMCFSCEAKGVIAGSNKPGFFPYSYLIGGSGASQLHYAISNFTHWEHARYILDARFGIAGRYAKLVYSAALKLYHKISDPRIVGVFSAGANLIRLERRWSTLNGETYGEFIPGILERLPACQMPKADGGIAISKEMVARFTQPHDLSAYGYQAFTPIFGLRIFTHRLAPMSTDDISIVMQPPYLAPETLARYRPRYIAPSHRLDLEAAWGRIESVCPGVQRHLVYALIAAKGVAEGGMSMPPMIYLTGVTGSGKSSTVTLASTICGDVNTEVIWTNNIERVRQAIHESKCVGTYVTFNEMVKESERAKSSPVAAMDFMLNLTPNSVSHKLFKGPVRMGSLPVFVWTDTAIPNEVESDAQLARRLIRIKLPSYVDWKTTLRASGVGQITNLRTYNESYAEACNAIVSYVIDKYFTEPMTFEDICTDLGFIAMAEGDAAISVEDTLRHFFAAVSSAPELTGPDATRWQGRGWKLVNAHGERPIDQLWQSLNDESLNGKVTCSRRCSERDWQVLLTAHEPVEFEISAHSPGRIAVRFISAARTRKTYRVNMELVAGENGIHRPRDSERSGFEIVRKLEVPTSPFDSPFESGSNG